jgi:hypothetical protein
MKQDMRTYADVCGRMRTYAELRRERDELETKVW